MRKNQAKQVENTRIRVLTINKKRFVVGLAWETIKAQRTVNKEIKRIGKEKNLDVVAVRKSDSIQAGFAPKTNLKLRGCYSLIVALTTLLKGCCIAVIPVGKTETGEAEFTLVGRTESGGIHPHSDELYLESELNQAVIDLKSYLRGSNDELDIEVYSDADFGFVTASLNLEEILQPRNLSKEFKLKPLTWGLTRQQLVFAGIAATAIIGGLLFLRHQSEQAEQDRIDRLIEQKARQDKINREARYKAALDKLRHPWIEQPSVADFIQNCDSMLSKVDLSIVGWVPTALHCTRNQFSASYARPDGSAARTDEFVDAIRKKFGVPVDFNFQNTSVTSFSLPLEMKPNGDDPMLNIGFQMLKMISVFQRLNIPADFKCVEIKEQLENEFKEKLPTQDWQEFNFDISTLIPARAIFQNESFQGVRLNVIDYIFESNQHSFKYNFKGTIYAQHEESNPNTCSVSSGK